MGLWRKLICLLFGFGLLSLSGFNAIDHLADLSNHTVASPKAATEGYLPKPSAFARLANTTAHLAKNKVEFVYQIGGVERVLIDIVTRGLACPTVRDSQRSPLHKLFRVLLI